MRLLLLILAQFFSLILCFGQSSLIDDIYNSSLSKIKVICKSDTFELIEYKITDMNNVRYGLTVCFIKIPLERVNLKIDELREYSSVIDVFEKRCQSSDVIITNGGYFEVTKDGERAPLGLSISNGITLSDKVNWREGGILFQANDTVGIIHINDYTDQKFREAIQCKPILVRNSKNDIYSNSDSYFDRISIGITNANELIVCGAFNQDGIALSIYEFGEFLSTCSKKPCPNLNISLYLDGGPSAHIYIPVLGKHYGYSSNNYLPNIIHISLN